MNLVKVLVAVMFIAGWTTAMVQQCRIANLKDDLAHIEAALEQAVYTSSAYKELNDKLNQSLTDCEHRFLTKVCK